MGRNEDNDDWRMQPDWVERLSSDTGRALVSTDESMMAELVKEVEPLLQSGMDGVALLLAQAGLYRALRGPITPDSDLSAHLLSSLPHLDTLLTDAGEATVRSPFLADSLNSVGRVLVEKREYLRAVAAFRAAASVWDALEAPAHEAVLLLRAGAAALHNDDLENALTLSERSLARYVRLGDSKGAVMASLNLAQARNQLAGDVDGALVLLEQARTYADGMRDGHLTTSILLEAALLDLETGRIDQGQNGLRSAYRRARRRGDGEQAFVAAKNLAISEDEEGSTAARIRWWGIAAELAAEIGDWRERQGCERARGIAFAQAGKYDDAVAALDRAITINLEHDAALDAARSKADKGAVLLEFALKGDASDEDFTSHVIAASTELDAARHDLESLQDWEWAAITVRNLRSAWVLQNHEATGASTLIDASEEPHCDEDYLVELRRNAAWLLLSAGTDAADDPRVVEWLVDAATRELTNGIDRAWALAKVAALTASHGFADVAFRLYSVALAEFSPQEDPSAYGNMLNDSTVVMGADADPSVIRERLQQVEHIGRDTNDRVLLALALSNLGENARRRDDLEAAREYWNATVELATELGDDGQAASALASLSNTYLSEGRPEEADRVSARAMDLAVRSGSIDAQVDAISARSSLSYLQGDYEAAFEGWARCIEMESPDHSGEHQAFALDSLARLGGWPRFRSQLDRYAKTSQKSDTQFVFVESLHRPALTWLREGKPSATGTVLAYGVLLSFEAASKVYGKAGREMSTAERDRFLVRVSSALGAARAIFLLLDLPEKDLRRVRAAYERTVRRAAREMAEEIIDVADTLIYSPDDD